MNSGQLTELAQKLEEALALLPTPTELLPLPHGNDLLIAWRQISDAQLKVLEIRNVYMKKKA